jgi:hypothetical protein
MNKMASGLCPMHLKELEKRQKNDMKTVEALAKLDSRMERQEKDTDRLFEIFRELKNCLDELKLTIKDDINSLKGCIEKKHNKSSKRLLGLELKILGIFMLGGIVWQLILIWLKSRF